MAHDDDSSEKSAESPAVNPGFVLRQLAKAEETVEFAEDPALRERARTRLAKWRAIWDSMTTGWLRVGSRQPVEKFPVWVTLEVMHGGFASGAALAGGPLLPHEKILLNRLPDTVPGRERQALNSYFLSHGGLRELRGLLERGTFQIGVPEEAALPVVAWLAATGAGDAAADVLEEISPLFGQLRFYPVPLGEKVPEPDGRVVLQTAEECAAAVKDIEPRLEVLRYREAVELWIPIYDRAIGLFLETVEDGWPCQHYPEGWADRAAGLAREYARAKKESPGGGLGHPRQNRSRLLWHLETCSHSPRSLSGGDVGEIRGTLERYAAKLGIPSSPEHRQFRAKQRSAAFSRPAIRDLVPIVLGRLRAFDPGEEKSDPEYLLQPLTAAETENERWIGAELPGSVKRKLARCRRATPAELVESGIIPSSESLAAVLPQVTSDIFAMNVPDPQLRRILNGAYRAFRQRRSLLLLDYARQTVLEDLPWVRAVLPFAAQGSESGGAARRFLREIVLVTLRSFPQTLLPNKLIRELTALASSAALEIAFVEELATDIFMGDFGGKFAEAAKMSADLLDGTLYAAYYRIDLAEIRAMEITKPSTRSPPDSPSTSFGGICHARAAVNQRKGGPAANGMIVEQQQILTTHNLAPLFLALELRGELAGDLAGMARRCFSFICRRLQKLPGSVHGELIALKNSAYAWRQMIFFVSLLPQPEQQEFLDWAAALLRRQGSEFQERFEPALQGLIDVSQGRPFSGKARPFLGWSVDRHWLRSRPSPQ